MSDSFSVAKTADEMNEGLWFRRFGRPEDVLALETAPLSSEVNELRVKMELSPINPSDLIPVPGAEAHRVSPPRVAGYEGVGVVVAAPQMPHLVGQRVLPLRGPGTWQRYVDVGTDWTVPVPPDIPNAIAARAFINPLTAHLLLEKWNPRGKRVLVTAANASCAVLISQIALERGAVAVVGIFRHSEHREVLERIGVRPVLEEDATGMMLAIAHSDLIFDAVGGILLDRLASTAHPAARIVSYGLLSGSPPTKTDTWKRVHLFRLVDAIENARPSDWSTWYEQIWSALRNCHMPPLEHYPVADWHEGISASRKSKRSTKIALSFS